MTAEQMNRKLAEWCGWKHHSSGYWQGPMGLNASPPSYTTSLDAVAEVEVRLDISQLSEYADMLDKVCVPTHICPLTHWQSVVMAKASQRCEALCRTLGLWEEAGK